MAEVSVRWIDGQGVVRHGGIEDLPTTRGSECVWVEVVGPEQATFDELRRWFPLHALAVEDCMHPQQRPKNDNYEDHLFFVWVTPVAFPEGHPQATSSYQRREVEAFLGKDFLITVHMGEPEVVAASRFEADKLMAEGPDRLLHAVVDRLVDGVLTLVDDLSDELEEIQDALLVGAGRVELDTLHDVRRRLFAIHRIISPEREMIRALPREMDLIDAEAHRYFQDVGDHLARVEDSIETSREIAAASMDIYLTSMSNRMNSVMKTLTVVATIFMPLTLVSGIYGMNFRYFPELGWRYGYAFALGLMCSIAASMVWYFKRRDWW